MIARATSSYLSADEILDSLRCALPAELPVSSSRCQT